METLPQEYEFKQKPRFSEDVKEVTLGIDDFQEIMAVVSNCLVGICQISRFADGASSNSRFGIDRQKFCKPRIHRDRCPEGLESYKAAPAPPPPKKFTDPIEHLVATSEILDSPDGRLLGESPLDFLREHLPEFSTATKIFATRDLLPKTEVAADFHAACNNVPNVLVIIKSGQYIAGGYTEVPFESREYDHYNDNHIIPNANLTTFLFSVNRRKIYPLTNKDKALFCERRSGPSFGLTGLTIISDYSLALNGSGVHESNSSFHDQNSVQGELFGTARFAIDEYEVFRLN